MGVGVKGEASGEVTQHAGNGLNIHTILQCQRSKGVPKLVEAENGDYGIITTKIC